MKKILRLQSALLKEIDKYEKLVPERSHFIDWERVHISSCAKLGYVFAEERGVDPILAACACAVHDYGRIITGKQEGHAEAGYEPAMEFLRGTGLFEEDEIQQMGIAVRCGRAGLLSVRLWIRQRRAKNPLGKTVGKRSIRRQKWRINISP